MIEVGRGDGGGREPAVEPSWSLLALGGGILAVFALVFASLTLVLSWIEPVPLLLLFPFLFGPIALVGGVLGLVGRARARRAEVPRKGAGIGLGAAVAAAVTLLGILPAAVALGLPRFRAFQLDSREAQALHFLSQLRMGAVAHRHASPDRRFPPGDTGWVPAADPTARRYPYDASAWAQEPWISLDFAPSTAHFHQYRYRALNGERGFAVSARGDLDGDGILATYTSTVTVGIDGRVHREGPTRWPGNAR